MAALVRPGIQDGAEAPPPLKWTCHNINAVKLTIRYIGIDQLQPGIWQHRKTFSKKGMLELTASMKAAGGNVVPVIVCPNPSGVGFMIIAGERRWRAAPSAGVHNLLCIIGEYNFDQARFIAAAENIQREDLNPIEEATSYFEMQETNLSHEEIAKQIGKSRGHVSNYIRLLSLGFAVRELIRKGELSASQARPLCTLECTNEQLTVAKMAAKGRWTYKRIESEVAVRTDKKSPVVKMPKEDADVKRLTQLVSETTGYPTVIVKKPDGKWQMGFSMSNADEFEGMLHRLGIKVDY
jgi:ParB family chromosome partitioning protein